MILRAYLVTLCLFFCITASPQVVKLTQKFDSSKTPPRPEYSKNASWAALPFIKDEADTTPGLGIYKDLQSNAIADIFFIHPTTYTYKPLSPNQWNGDINDVQLNQKTNSGTIRYQASLFNGAGKIYAPYYRQAHYYSYVTSDTLSARLALDVAYSDVKKAFEFYLKNYNNGRPIIIASHSQGTTHAIRLMKDYFDTTYLINQLVCAYLVGMPVYDSVFIKLKPCQNDNQTGCYCSWRTYAVGYYPKKYIKPGKFSVCTNPLTWKTNETYASAELNSGGILRNMNTVIPKLCDAQIADGVLRIHKPNFKGNIFLNIKNYHIADYNLFYSNVRENAILRKDTFIKNKS